MEVRFKGVSKTYQTGAESVHVLKDVHFHIQSGDWLTITGASGSGKTTLLRCISAIELADSGEVLLGGMDPAAVKEEERRAFRREYMGYITQDCQLFEQFDILKNVMIPLLPYRPHKEAEEKAKQLLDRVGLSERLKHVPSQLSGGEKQRAAIARALMNDPKLIICDEPTGNLDLDNRNKIMDLLSDIHQNDVTIILVTHDTELAHFGNVHYEMRNGMFLEKLHR